MLVELVQIVLEPRRAESFLGISQKSLSKMRIANDLVHDRIVQHAMLPGPFPFVDLFGPTLPLMFDGLVVFFHVAPPDTVWPLTS